MQKYFLPVLLIIATFSLQACGIKGPLEPAPVALQQISVPAKSTAV